MKKFLIFCLIFFLSQNIFAIEKNITISASVKCLEGNSSGWTLCDTNWEFSYPSKIEITSPDYLDEVWVVEYIEHWSSVAIDFLITDLDSSEINFTITSSFWAISIENWTWVSISSWWYQNQFVFLAWDATWIWEIFLTSSDWVSLTKKKILVYIY